MILAVDSHQPSISRLSVVSRSAHPSVRLRANRTGSCQKRTSRARGARPRNPPSFLAYMRYDELDRQPEVHILGNDTSARRGPLIDVRHLPPASEHCEPTCASILSNASSNFSLSLHSVAPFFARRGVPAFRMEITKQRPPRASSRANLVAPPACRLRD